jgi:hypothetical protein
MGQEREGRAAMSDMPGSRRRANLRPPDEPVFGSGEETENDVMATLYTSANGNVAHGNSAEHVWTDKHRDRLGRLPQSRPNETPRKALQTAIESWTAKAEWNEKGARRATRTIVWSSAAIPIAIVASTAGQEFLVGRLIPSVLGGLAACAVGWLQFARPYEGWKLFRQYQRWGEIERFRYENGLEPYNASSENENDRRLGRRLIELEIALEPKWEHLLPPDGAVTVEARHR